MQDINLKIYTIVQLVTNISPLVETGFFYRVRKSQCTLSYASWILYIINSLTN